TSPKAKPRLNWKVFVVVLITGLGAWFSDSFHMQDGHYGLWSLVPPFAAIVLAFWTREVVSSLFAGVVLGGIISGKINIVQEFLIPAIGTSSFALILLVYLWALGGLIGIWTRTGGAEAFAHWASQRMVRGPVSAKFFTWMMGIVF